MAFFYIYLLLTGNDRLAQALASHTTFIRQITRLQTIAYAPVLVRVESLGQLEFLRRALSVSACAMDELAEALRLLPKINEWPDTTVLVQDCLGIGLSLRTYGGRIAEFVENSRPVMTTIVLEGETARTFTGRRVNYCHRGASCHYGCDTDASVSADAP